MHYSMTRHVKHDYLITVLVLFISEMIISLWEKRSSTSIFHQIFNLVPFYLQQWIKSMSLLTYVFQKLNKNFTSYIRKKKMIKLKMLVWKVKLSHLLVNIIEFNLIGTQFGMHGCILLPAIIIIIFFNFDVPWNHFKLLSNRISKKRLWKLNSITNLETLNNQTLQCHEICRVCNVFLWRYSSQCPRVYFVIVSYRRSLATLWET